MLSDAGQPAGDFDNDGDVDFYMSSTTLVIPFFKTILILPFEAMNLPPGASNLKIAGSKFGCVGTKSNRDGIGTRVISKDRQLRPDTRINLRYRFFG